MERKEKFSVAFKLEFVELHKNSYRAIESIATEKGFNESNLRKWIGFIISTEYRDYSREKS